MDEQEVQHRLYYGPGTRTGLVHRIKFNDLLWLDWDAVFWNFPPTYPGAFTYTFGDHKIPPYSVRV